MFAETSKSFDEDDVANALEEIYASTEVEDSIGWAQKKVHTLPQIMHYTYHAYEYLPLWVNENGNTNAAEAFLKDLDKMKLDGVDPERYHLSALTKQLDEVKKAKEPAVNALLALDTSLTLSYLNAAQDLLLGLVVPKKADSLWFHANDSEWHPEQVLISTLYGNEQYPSLDSFRSNLPAYKALVKAKEHYLKLNSDQQLTTAKTNVATASTVDSDVQYIIKTEVPWLQPADTLDANTALVKAYQYYYGVAATGKLDTTTRKLLSRSPADATGVLDINLERLRWMQRDVEPLYVLVDVPLMELFLRKDGKDLMHMNVVVGKTIRQTPSLNAKMANIVINPPWGVPPTILKNDVLPGMQKSGVAYLAKKDLQVYDHKGKLVDASQVNASNYKKFVFRQPPGDDNALGYVKFNLPNKYDIYLHDTPHRELFSKSDRAQSSGCVRVQQPKEMAAYILSELDGKRYDIPRIDSVIQTQKTRTVVLTNKIPVHIVYLTAMEDGAGNARFIKDIYKRDNKLAALLKEGNTKVGS